MDSFRGSIPPNFISFRLENQTTEVVDVPAEPTATTSAASPPIETDPQIQSPGVSQELSRSRAEDVTSTHSADSDPDVTSYAESMVQQMQQAQLITAQEDDQPESAQLQGQEPLMTPRELCQQRLRTEGRAPPFSQMRRKFRKLICLLWNLL